MATRQIASARMELAHREAVEVVKAHDSPERLVKLEAMNNPNTRRPEALASFQAELIASLAGMVSDLYENLPQSKAAKKKTS
jgi:hypothetical protein